MFQQIREQAAVLWQKQSNVQRTVLIVLAVVVLAAIGLFTAWANTPNYAVAFSGVSEADAGLIVQKLVADKVPYQVQAGSTILVPADKVYEVRLSMASQGLPQGGTVGFELFNGATLGMTDFTQQVNYQRALEGELERTIGSLKAIKSVRVAIVTPQPSLLSSQQAPTTASVTIEVQPGQQMDAGQVQAITHLVASSVEGLKPENVVVVDVDGNLLANGGADGGATQNGTASSSQRAAEAAYAGTLETKVRGLLDTVLGPNKSVVKANVVMDWTQTQVNATTYDPVTNTIRSSQTTSETFLGDAANAGGIPGVASNLPPLTAGSSLTGTQGSAYQRLENTTNYEVSQHQTTQTVAPCTVQRVSLSVMVDGITNTQQLDSLKTVVAAAAGIDTARGDTLAVQSLAFDHSFAQVQVADMAKSAQTDLYMRLGFTAGAVLLALLVLWYVQRLLSRLRLSSAEAWKPVLMPVAALSGPAQPLAAIAPSQVAVPLAAPIARPAPAPIPVEQLSAEEEQLRKTVTELAEHNPVTVAEIIHIWLSEEKK